MSEHNETAGSKSRYDIYREVQHELYMEDAARHVEDYLSWSKECNGIMISPEITFDYDELARAFEENHDCNIADNDQWDHIIDSYVQGKELVILQAGSGKNSISQIQGKEKPLPGIKRETKER